MEQATLGIGTRLQHTLHGPGVIIVVKYATYLIAFINTGIKEIDKADTQLDEIIPENVTAEVETVSETEKSLLKILRMWGGFTETVPLGEKWQGGKFILQPADNTLKPKEIPIVIVIMAADQLPPTLVLALALTLVTVLADTNLTAVRILKRR